MNNNDLFGAPSNEGEIESSFLREFLADERNLTRTAQVALGPDETAEATNALDANMDATPETPAGGPQDAAGQELPDLDTDESEMDAIKTLLPWDSFSIIFDPHYSGLLEETLQLPPAKAKAKSFYIYFAPENKRLEGVVNKRYIGGYGTKEEMGEDFEFIKGLSPEGFSPEWREKLLTPIDELPAVENTMVAEKLREKSKQSSEEANQESVETPPAPPAPEGGPAAAPSVAPPTPVGKACPGQMPAAAKWKEMTMRRMSRLKMLKSI